MTLTGTQGEDRSNYTAEESRAIRQRSLRLLGRRLAVSALDASIGRRPVVRAIGGGGYRVLVNADALARLRRWRKC